MCHKSVRRLKNFVVALVVFLSVAFASRAGAVGVPRISFTPNGCQGVSVVVSDSTPGDQGLADVTLLFDPDGIYTTPGRVSINVAYDPVEPFFYPEDLVVKFRIKVLNPTKPAYAAIWAVNHTGQSIAGEWRYTPPPLTLSVDSLALTNTRVGNDTCATFTLYNSGNTPFTLSGLKQPSTGYFQITGVSPAANTELKAKQTMQVTVCYHARDTAFVHDTIGINIDCYFVPIPMTGLGRSPIIYAEDIEMNGVDKGETVCNPLRVWNRGNSPLVIDNEQTVQFFNVEGAATKTTIDPGSYHDFNTCFAPTAYGRFTWQLLWITNLPAAYLHSEKDHSNIVAISAPAGLHWDRLHAFYDPANGTSNVDTFFVTNTSATIAHLDSIAMGGADAGDFLIGYNYPVNRDIQSHQKLTYDISFVPNLFNTARDRSATAYIMSNGVAVDSLSLTGRIATLGVTSTPSPSRAELFTIYPNPNAGSTLHVNATEKITSIEIFDMLGGRVRQFSDHDGSTTDIPLGGLTPGSYIIRVETSSGISSKRLSIVR